LNMVKDRIKNVDHKLKKEYVDMLSFRNETG
jgi:hypothetical protein